MAKDYIDNIEGAERRAVSHKVEYREEGEQKYFEGYGIVFDTPTDMGPFTEEVAPGAESDVMNDDVRGLMNHGEDQVLGRTKSGTMTLSVDSTGVRYKILYNPNDPDHVRAREKVMRGDISQSSFAFRVKDDKWEKRNGKEHRRITKFAKLIDMSLVTYAAYESTSVAMRSANRPNDNYKKDLAEMEKDSMKLDLEMIKNKTK
jgi:uncharacterized protein